jgi:hypothetical protein
VHRIELLDEHARPVIEHVSDPNMVRHGEREVHVGEAVATVHGERADGGPGHDPLILLRELQQALAESIPLLNGEHRVRS